MIEAIKWSCNRVPPNREWVSEFSLMIHEHDILKRLKCDFDVPCTVQWSLVFRAYKDKLGFGDSRTYAGDVRRGYCCSPGVVLQNFDVGDLSDFP